VAKFSLKAHALGDLEVCDDAPLDLLAGFSCYMLLALVAAVRARSLDGFFIEHGKSGLYFPFTSMVPEGAGCSAVAGCPDMG
jgi:hypothetical protein